MDKLKLAGYLIRYSGPNDPDLSNEYFTKATDYGVEDGAIIPIYFNHGLDETIGKRRLGRGKVSFKAKGVYIAGAIELHNDYDWAIAELVEAGALAWSSGAPGHLTDLIEHPNGAKMITTWILAEASLTPYPAEARNTAQAVKADCRILVERRARILESLRLRAETNRLRFRQLRRRIYAGR
jgi:hypothetical protein